MRSIAVFIAFALVTVTVSFAQEDTRQEMRSLDEQVQEIKTDVLGIARDLSLLEERLLFPSNTQVSVFVEMPNELAFRLDAIQIAIDGNPVAHHIYTFKELEALQNGGVQRVYTGNLTTGSHDIAVAVSGKLSNGDDFTSSQNFSFSKGIEPELLGLSLGGQGRSASIELGNW